MSVQNSESVPDAFALGIRQRRNSKTLDAWFPCIYSKKQESYALASSIYALFQDFGLFISQETPYFKALDVSLITRLLKHLELENCKTIDKLVLEHCLNEHQSSTRYSQADLIFFVLPNLATDNSAIQSVEEAYFKLQLISQKHVLPHGTNLKGLFSILPTLAWTNRGPRFPEDVLDEQVISLFKEEPLLVHSLDKFPYLLQYYIPPNVRIADGSKVRLGAYLGSGCTVMPAGYVNFNAGAQGPNMIEGRISAGVFVGEKSDIGGGASIMGTLSGGNHLTITIGAACLLGANSGTGISLGIGCTIAAGLYIYAGMKIALVNAEGKPINLRGELVTSGQNTVKALDLSGRDYMLFIQDSQSGQVFCKPNTKIIQLNAELHKNSP